MARPTPSSAAPWKEAFLQQLEKAGGAGAEFTLATVTPTGLPRVRTCIYRGFWATLPDNEHNDRAKNAETYESDCPTFTTDARMSKVYEIFATGRGRGDARQARAGSGGGGPVEAVYWFKSTMAQWRIRGKCWILAADDIEGGPEAQNSGTVTVKTELGRYMRVRDGSSHAAADTEWSWRREIENTFENLSPMMRGTFKNPPPGQPLSQGQDEAAGEALGQRAGHLADEELARRNFRVAVITPEQVELVDLSDPANCRRRVWTLAEEAGGPTGDGGEQVVGEWNQVDVWP